jgi:hypothetical protein
MRKGQRRGVGGLLHFLASMHDTDDNFNGCTRSGGERPFRASDSNPSAWTKCTYSIDRSMTRFRESALSCAATTYTHSTKFRSGRKEASDKGTTKKKVCKISKRTQTPVTVYYSSWLELHFSVSFRRVMLIFV